MQEYLRQLLDEIAQRPTLDEVLRRAGSRAGGRLGLAEAAAAVRADRDER